MPVLQHDADGHRQRYRRPPGLSRAGLADEAARPARRNRRDDADAVREGKHLSDRAGRRRRRRRLGLLTEPNTQSRGVDHGLWLHPESGSAARTRACVHGRAHRAAHPPVERRSARGPVSRVVHGGAEGTREGRRAVEPVPAAPEGRRARHGPDQPRIRAARRDHGARELGVGSVQLQRAGHRQHGTAAHVRDAGAARTVAAAAAARRDPVGVRDDRARRGIVGCDQHHDAYPARRRRLRDRRPQVVHHERRASELQDLHRDGQDRSRCRVAPAAEHDPRAARHAGRDDRAQHHGGQSPCAGRALRDHVRQCAGAGAQPARRGRQRLRARAGAPRPGPHPSLHAFDRRGRAGLGADDRPRTVARGVRQAAESSRHGRRMDRAVAHRDRPGAPAGAEGRVDDRQGWREGGAQGNLDDQGARADRVHGRMRPRDAGVRRDGPEPRHAARRHVDLGPRAALRRRPGRGAPAGDRADGDQGRRARLDRAVPDAAAARLSLAPRRAGAAWTNRWCTP
ncbi:LigA [Burkholderia ambifaria]